MVLSIADWLIVICYMILIIWIGVKLQKRASGSIEDFFISSRKLSWWLIGTSMVATAFASDTPLFITSLVRKYGIGGAWYYCNASINGIISAFVFAPLWRRSLAVTDAEFREMRYSGRSGKVLRSVWAIHRGVLGNCITMGWVILAVIKMGKVALGLPPEVVIMSYQINSTILLTVGVLIIVLIYSTLSGLWGVVVIDFVQFFVAFIGSVVLAILSIKHIGGIEVFKEKIMASPEAGADFLKIVPSFGTVAMMYFIVGLTVLWWSSIWVDGGIMMAQRTLAAKDERHAVLGRYWGNLAQMGIIVWPWIIIALCSLIIFPASKFPELASDPESAYPKMIVTIMPSVLRGFIVAAFLAAFMSTVDSLINNTSSYMVNDIYKRFLVRNAAPGNYVLMGRLGMILATAIGGFIAIISKEILVLSMLIVEITAGVGMIFILRWLWWRINAWSELTSYMTGLTGAFLIKTKIGKTILMQIALFLAPQSKASGIRNFFTETMNGIGGFPFRMIFLALFTTVICLVVTLLTKPCETDHLIRFYKKIKPPGPGWRKIHNIAGPLAYEKGQIKFKVSTVLVGAVFFYAVFFALGKLPLGYYNTGIIALLISILSGMYLWKTMKKDIKT